MSNENKKGFKKKFTDMFDLPKEITLNLPLVTIIGSDEMDIENYKGIVEYTEEKIRINTSVGIIRIEGRKLEIKQITKERMKIVGFIKKFEYLL